MPAKLSIHEGCGGKLVHPAVYYKDENNEPDSIALDDLLVCTKCKQRFKDERKITPA